MEKSGPLCTVGGTVKCWSHYEKTLSSYRISIFQNENVLEIFCSAMWKYLALLILVTHSRLFVMLWIVACQTLLSMEFSRQEYWSGLPFPSPGKSSQPKDQTQSSSLQADSLPHEPPGKPLLTLLRSEVAQLCPTLCDPMNCSLPGSSVHWILQARILEWVDISLSKHC